MRLEKDSIGDVPVPADALYGASSCRGTKNLRTTGEPIAAYPTYIETMARVKKAAAIANGKADRLPAGIVESVVTACDEIIGGDFHDQFIIPLVEGSGGTSTNMNFNEVIANRAGQILGGALGRYDKVHPNDHVNCGQSTNDVIPTAVKLACYVGCGPLLSAGGALVRACEDKAAEYERVLRLGRTCMQAAQPMTYGQLFGGYASSIRRALEKVEFARQGLTVVPLGATAIGTGLGAAPAYREVIADSLSAIFGFAVSSPEDPFDAMSSADAFSRFSSELNILAATLGKIAADLVILSSGGNSGIGEVILPALQPGSSIMAGKVNPVMCMTMQQVAFIVAGNHTTVSLAALSGQMEINHFEPVIARALFSSIEALTNGCERFAANCIEGLKVDGERSWQNLIRSSAMSSMFLPNLGYDRVTALVRQAADSGEPLIDVAVREGLLSQEQINDALASAVRGLAVD